MICIYSQLLVRGDDDSKMVKRGWFEKTAVIGQLVLKGLVLVWMVYHGKSGYVVLSIYSHWLHINFLRMTEKFTKAFKDLLPVCFEIEVKTVVDVTTVTMIELVWDIDA